MVYLLISSYILLICAIFYIVYLSKCIKQVGMQMEEKAEEDTNTLITTKTNHKEVRELIIKINTMMDEIHRHEVELERKNKRLQQTIVNISHDLKTPLTSTIGYLEILQKYPMSDEKTEEYEEIIMNRLLHLQTLIDDFFNFTKMVYSQEVIELQKTDIMPILYQTIGRHYEDFNMQGRQIQIHGEKEVKIPVNEAMVQRIFDNLIINALQHSSSDVDIYVDITTNVTLTFVNTLNQSIEIDHIFDEFYTSDISRTKQNTGLGLAIVKEFSERLGASVSAKQKGEKLYITLKWD